MKMLKLPFLLTCLMTGSVFLTSARAQTGMTTKVDYTWWEAENPAQTTFPLSAVHPAKADAEQVSGGDWLLTDKGAGATATWEVQVTSGGEYNFWGRMHVKSGAFQWRWNAGEWQSVPKDFKYIEYKEFVPNILNIPPLGWGFSWVSLGKVQLPAGKNTLEVKMSPEAGKVAFDCWLLNKFQDIPFRTEKPDLKFNRAAQGWFPFEPDRDDFLSSLMDLRSLNEKEAGSQGRIVAKGDDFVFEKTGKKVRFWGATLGDINGMDKADIDYMARRFAKMGINLIRLHAGGPLQQDPKKCVENMHYLVAAFKKQGIYSELNWGCTAQNGKPLCFYIDDVMMKEFYLKWPEMLLKPLNPYTGLSLAKDPAVMAVELIDEDSIFWHTFKPRQSLWPEAWDRAEHDFHAWLQAKYGSLEKATAAWGPGQWPKGDNFDKQRVAMYPGYLLGCADWALAQRNPQRAADQVEFMTYVQRKWTADLKTWLQKELGYDGIVIGSNWQGADTRNLDPLDQYANMAGDATAWNCYFAGLSTTGSRVTPKDIYTDLSLLKNPLQGVIMHKRVAGRPHLMTEGDWCLPNRFRAEEPFMEACYGSLQGMGGWCLFALEGDWINKYVRRWPMQVPVVMGQHPAAALIYRNEYVKEAPVVINDALALKDLYALKGATFVPQFRGSVDFNAKAEAASGKTVASAETDPVKIELAQADGLAYYVGRVQRTIAENPGASYILPDLNKHIDRKAQVVRSVTGEMMLDYGKGLCTVNAPCAQGATGFLQAAGTLALADVSIAMQNEYGTVLVVSLDGKPLKSSAKILVQVMTEEQQYGYTTAPIKHAFAKGQPEIDCLQVVSNGVPPICVRNFSGSITLMRADAGKFKVAALDINGHKTRDLPTGSGDTLTIELLPNCLYYVIQK